MYHLLALLLLPVLALAAPLPTNSTIPTLDPTIPTLDPTCHTYAAGNLCPAQLRTNNLLLTATNQVQNDDPLGRPQFHNILRAGFHYSLRDARLYEESTFAIFEFPESAPGRKCRFQFISDGGDRLDPVVNVYNVWSLLDPNAARPQRDEVVASFSTARSVYLSKNLKTVHPFLFGPGESAPVYKDAEDVPQDTFACPQGRVVWEVAAAIRDFGTNETMTVGGASGLGVEVIGLPSGW